MPLTPMPSRTPLISDLLMELVSGRRVALNSSFVLAPGLPGVGASDEGDRAPDSNFVVRSGDEIPMIYSVTVPGVLTAPSPTALLDSLQLFSDQLAQCRKLWRAGRCYLPVAYGLLPPPEMRQGWMSCEVAPIFRLSRVGWFTSDGRRVFG